MFLARLLSEPEPFAKPEDTSLDGHGGPKMPQQCAVFAWGTALCLLSAFCSVLL